MFYIQFLDHVIFDRTGEVVFWLMTYFNCSIKIRTSQVRKRPLSDVEMKMVYFWQMGKSMNFYNHAISNLLPLLIVATWLWLSITLKVTESQTNVTVYKCNITIQIKCDTHVTGHKVTISHKCNPVTWSLWNSDVRFWFFVWSVKKYLIAGVV